MRKSKIKLSGPMDFHVHLRTGVLLIALAKYTSSVFARAMVKGNFIKEPVWTPEQAIDYRAEIEMHSDVGFKPIMSIMLVRHTTPHIIRRARKAGIRVLAYIPSGTSTGSGESFPLWELKNYYDCLEEARKLGMIFSGHWELMRDPETGKEIPEIDREERALPYLKDAVNTFPGLKMVVEHVSTATMIQAVEKMPDNVGVTLTCHHAILDYHEVMDKEGRIIDPYKYCKPIAKKENDRLAVRKAMVSGNPKFFFGSDSASHLISAKDCEKPAAGIFTPGRVSLPTLAEIFDMQGATEKLDNFVSEFGPRFYGIKPVLKPVILKEEPWVVPYTDPEGLVRIFRGGEILFWSVKK